MAAAKGCTPAQLALAWLLAQGDDVVPIPGTKRRRYLEQNAGALRREAERSRRLGQPRRTAPGRLGDRTALCRHEPPRLADGEVLAALEEQQAELDELLAPLDDAGWATPTPAVPGLDGRRCRPAHGPDRRVRRVPSAADRFAEFVAGFAAAQSFARPLTISPRAMVERERANRAPRSCRSVAGRGRGRVRRASGAQPARPRAVGGGRHGRPHAGDDAPLGNVDPHRRRGRRARGHPVAHGAVRHIARLAWRTFPYAFSRDGQSLSGPVAVVAASRPTARSWTSPTTASHR